MIGRRRRWAPRSSTLVLLLLLAGCLGDGRELEDARYALGRLTDERDGLKAQLEGTKAQKARLEAELERLRSKLASLTGPTATPAAERKTTAEHQHGPTVSPAAARKKRK
jgi:hypothetical protein